MYIWSKRRGGEGTNHLPIHKIIIFIVIGSGIAYISQHIYIYIKTYQYISVHVTETNRQTERHREIETSPSPRESPPPHPLLSEGGDAPTTPIPQQCVYYFQVIDSIDYCIVV